jgi:long-chain acyl-CoA synthetase
VEEVLYRHPAILECAVVGVPDRIKGEIAKAVVATRPGTSPPAPDDLDAYCRTHLAAYKVPRAYEFVPELPKSPSGKILKRVLRQDVGPPR